MPPHPISRFFAPSSIQAGSSLADLFDATAIGLIGESFSGLHSGFDEERFQADAWAVADGLAFKARARAIATVLRSHLPGDDRMALASLRAAWGPELTCTEGNGLQPLFYLPHSALLATWARTTDDQIFSDALEANFELTTRFTAEFSMRSFLEARLGETLEALGQRLCDPNPHVRRLISEGTRPRLPWASHLRAVREDPALTLPLLAKLRDDCSRYVTRSVANHLGDIGKDHPEILFATCRRWIDDLDVDGLSPVTTRERRWLIRHALRHPAKKGSPEAQLLRRRAAP